MDGRGAFLASEFLQSRAEVHEGSSAQSKIRRKTPGVAALTARQVLYHIACKRKLDEWDVYAKRHYLQACVWIVFIFRVDPMTFKYRPVSLPEADARLMRECARDALKTQ